MLGLWSVLTKTTTHACILNSTHVHMHNAMSHFCYYSKGLSIVNHSNLIIDYSLIFVVTCS